MMALIGLADLSSRAGGEGAAVKTRELAKLMGVSQQSASRYLIELEGLGLISRLRAPRGEIVRITEEGSRRLAALYSILRGFFERPEAELVLEGKVFSGLGEGAYYVSQEGYRRQFIEKLGFDPYPGTLNLRLDSGSRLRRPLLDRIEPILIEGFTNGSRRFGPVKCFRAIVADGIEGAVLIAVRGHYEDDVIEVIAPMGLREALGLRDGQTLRVRIPLAPSPSRSSA
jgi:riboflavin kinase